MNKKGFTLVELIGVIAVLGILITIAVPNIINLIAGNQDKLTEDAINSLGDSAISYVSENIFLQKCPEGKKFTNTSEVTDAEKCATKVTVQKLIDSTFFDDQAKNCKRDGEVIVYRYIEGEIDELKFYVPDGTCEVKK